MNNKTLVIYDLNGSIIGSPITGFYKVPNGVPYIEIVVPNGKYVIGVNIETKEPIFDDIPLSETELLSNKIDILEAEKEELKSKLQATQEATDFMLINGGK